MSDKKRRLSNLMDGLEGRTGTSERNPAKDLLLGTTEPAQIIPGNESDKNVGDVSTSPRIDVNPELQKHIVPTEQPEPLSLGQAREEEETNMPKTTLTNEDGTSINKTITQEKLKKSTLLLPTEDHMALRIAALKQNLTMTQLVQEIIHTYLVEKGETYQYE